MNMVAKIRLVEEPPVVGVCLSEESGDLFLRQISTLVEEEGVLVQLVFVLVIGVHVGVVDPFFDDVGARELWRCFQRPGDGEGPG